MNKQIEKLLEVHQQSFVQHLCQLVNYESTYQNEWQAQQYINMLLTELPAEKGPKDSTGVWELLSDKRTSMIPQSLERMGRREKYDSNPAHSSLKDKRELREVQAIHSESNRQAGPFVVQNCASLPGSLLESLLFGTKKGSFTGAVDRKGLFELADKGSLFLDEIQIGRAHV